MYFVYATVQYVCLSSRYEANKMSKDGTIVHNDIREYGMERGYIFAIILTLSNPLSLGLESLMNDSINKNRVHIMVLF